MKHLKIGYSLSWFTLQKRWYVVCFVFLVVLRQELSNQKGFLDIKVRITTCCCPARRATWRWRPRWGRCWATLEDLAPPPPPRHCCPRLVRSLFRSVMIRESTCCGAFNLDCQSVRLPFALLGRRWSRSNRKCCWSLTPKTANAAPGLLLVLLLLLLLVENSSSTCLICLGPVSWMW